MSHRTNFPQSFPQAVATFHNPQNPQLSVKKRSLFVSATLPRQAPSNYPQSLHIFPTAIQQENFTRAGQKIQSSSGKFDFPQFPQTLLLLLLLFHIWYCFVCRCRVVLRSPLPSTRYSPQERNSIYEDHIQQKKNFR